MIPSDEGPKRLEKPGVMGGKFPSATDVAISIISSKKLIRDVNRAALPSSSVAPCRKNVFIVSKNASKFVEFAILVMNGCTEARVLSNCRTVSIGSNNSAFSPNN